MSEWPEVLNLEEQCYIHDEMLMVIMDNMCPKTGTLALHGEDNSINVTFRRLSGEMEFPIKHINLLSVAALRHLQEFQSLAPDDFMPKVVPAKPTALDVYEALYGTFAWHVMPDDNPIYPHSPKLAEELDEHLKAFEETGLEFKIIKAAVVKAHIDLKRDMHKEFNDTSTYKYQGEQGA